MHVVAGRDTLQHDTFNLTTGQQLAGGFGFHDAADVCLGLACCPQPR